jgi:phage recombination protein Bet
MTTTVIALPTSGDSSVWTDSERALVEAAGLVSGTGPNKHLAPRPVVEAFLLHARRTGLDPIARQIYCIERRGRWGTQVSIDGARLVAERTKEYRGQTPTQWTLDGVTWVDVWIDSTTPPKAARVGVYREGFVEPLVAVATMDAYNAGGPMWQKMPALMLGKCAEMLALRKAFPQDLSGLYSTEEMDQAGEPKKAAQVPPPAQPALIAEPTPEPSGRDWAAEAKALTSKDDLNALWSSIPKHERIPELFEQVKALAIELERKAQETWAEAQPPASEWAVATIPGEEATPESEEVVAGALEGMEPETETGGDDRG